MTTKYNHGFEALVGKTIESVSENFLNEATIVCTDGERFTVDTRSFGYGVYSPTLTKETE